MHQYFNCIFSVYILLIYNEKLTCKLKSFCRAPEWAHSFECIWIYNGGWCARLLYWYGNYTNAFFHVNHLTAFERIIKSDLNIGRAVWSGQVKPYFWTKIRSIECMYWQAYLHLQCTYVYTQLEIALTCTFV